MNPHYIKLSWLTNLDRNSALHLFAKNVKQTQNDQTCPTPELSIVIKSVYDVSRNLQSVSGVM